MTELAPASEGSVAEAAGHLRAGRLVAFPTETVYGLGGLATDESAVAGIYAAKGRPSNNPLIVHVPSLEAAESLAKFDARARRLAAEFWPGPLTLVLPKREPSPLAPALSPNTGTVALRVPAHPTALALLRATGVAVAAPSANPSGAVSPTTADHVLRGLGGLVAMILDDGPCAVGVESSVVAVLPGERARLLRPGGVGAERLAAALGEPLESLVQVTEPGEEPTAPASPGLIGRHYAPAKPLRLNAAEVREGEALLAFGSTIPTGAVLTVNLSPKGDLEQAARNLFAYLRALDRSLAPSIAVVPIPAHGLGLAINDRLRRAALP